MTLDPQFPPDKEFTYILCSAGFPQMYSHPITTKEKPQEIILQPLGWVSERTAFAKRVFRYSRTVELKDRDLTVMLYVEECPSPAFFYQGIDRDFFVDEVWQTPSEAVRSK